MKITPELIMELANEYLRDIYTEEYGKEEAESIDPSVGSRQTLAVVRAVAEILQDLQDRIEELEENA